MAHVIRRAKQVAAQPWPPIAAGGQRGWQWATVQYGNAQRWLGARRQAAFFATGVVVVVLLLIFSGVTAAVAAIAAWVALLRHFAQTEADRQRRITESFSKAVEQLAHQNIEVRLGGIYTLERISKESPDDYWTVMENLTAFIRERTRRMEEERLSEPLDQRLAKRAYLLWERHGCPEGASEAFWAQAVEEEPYGGGPPTTDITTALTVIKRRSEADRAREAKEDRILDFRHAILRGANLIAAHLEGADFLGADLRRANLMEAYLKGANLWFAHLEYAGLREANLEGANLTWALLKMANLSEAVLNGANLFGTHLEHATLGAHLEGAHLDRAHIEGADLSRAKGLRQDQIDAAFGDTATKLPEGLTPPAHWRKEGDGEAPAA